MNGHSEDSADDEALNDSDPESGMDDPLNSSREDCPEKSGKGNPDNGDSDDDDPDPSSFLETSLTEDVNAQEIGGDDSDDLEIIGEKPAPPKSKYSQLWAQSFTYFFDGRCLSRYKQSFFIYQVP